MPPWQLGRGNQALASLLRDWAKLGERNGRPSPDGASCVSSPPRPSTPQVRTPPLQLAYLIDPCPSAFCLKTTHSPIPSSHTYLALLSSPHPRSPRLAQQKGHLQSRAVPATYPTFFNSLSPATTLLLTSPFHRTVQTTLTAFASVLPPTSPTPIPLLILPQLQECGNQPCDTGDDLASTKTMFPQQFLDWSECTDGWNSNRGFYEASEEKQAERAKWVRRWIRERPEEKVVVICHHGFLRRITKTPQLGVSCFLSLLGWRVDRRVGVREGESACCNGSEADFASSPSLSRRVNGPMPSFASTNSWIPRD
jgi:broad specificity phosphatase PhoE